MSKERHVPYLATASLRKILDSLGSGCHITKLEAEAKTSDVEEKEGEGEDSIGLTVYKRTTTEAVIEYQGSPIYQDKLRTKLDEMRNDDMSVDLMRVKTKVDKKLKEHLRRPWLKGDGSETDILEQLSLDGMEHCYVVLKNKKVDFGMSDYKVDSNRTFRDFWSELNKCNVCDKPLEAHGFKHTTLNVTGIDFPWIRATLKKSQRPEVNAHKNVVASWIHQNVTKPTGLVSPNGMFSYKLGTEKGKWILRGV